MSKRILLLGASGAIGSSLFFYLLQEGYEVTPVVHTVEGKQKLCHAAAYSHWPLPNEEILMADVTDVNSLQKLVKNLDYLMDIVVYAVGDCPPQGMRKIMNTPPAKPCWEEAQKWDNLIVYGFEEVCSMFNAASEKKPVFLVIGSSITRLADPANKNLRPPFWENMEAYANAQVTLEGVVNRYRYHNLIHLIQPAAVIDTPFHLGPNGESPSYPGVTLAQVCSAVSEALKSSESVTKMVVPEYATAGA